MFAQLFLQKKPAKYFFIFSCLAALLLSFSACSAADLLGSQCTPSTCDYFINDMVVVTNGQGGDILLADAENAIYQYSGSQWNKIGNEKATVRGPLFVSPNFSTDNTLFLGNSVSTDGGKSWSLLCVSVIGISPNFGTDHLIFGKDAQIPGSGTPAATATASSTAVSATAYACPQTPGNFYTSTNNGQTWNTVSGPANTGDPNNFTISPTYSQDHTIFAQFTDTNFATNVFKTTDGGQTWSQILTGKQNLIAVSPEFATDQTIIAVNNTNAQISTNGGQTWAVLSAPVTSLEINELAFAPNFDKSHEIAFITFAADTGSTTANGLYTSTDSGKTWNQQSTVTQEGVNNPAFIFSPNFAQNSKLYLSSNGQGQGPAVSTDGGQTFTTFNSGLDLLQAPA